MILQFASSRTSRIFIHRQATPCPDQNTRGLFKRLQTVLELFDQIAVFVIRPSIIS
jgi:hypothetical protein